MDTDAVSSLVKDICGTPSGSHLLLALLPAGGPPSSLQLFARALNPSRTVFHVLHEGAHGGEVVVKFHGSPARAAREALVREAYAACPGGLGAAARPGVLFEDAGRGVSALARLTPHAEVRSELVAGNLFPLLSVAVADAIAAPLFHTSVWAQRGGGAPRGGPLGVLRGRGVGGAAAGGRCAAAGDDALATLFAALEGGGGSALGALLPAAALRCARASGACAAAAPLLRARLADGGEALLHGELTTAALMSGLVPLAPPPAVADFESMRPDEYPGGGTPSLMATAGGEAAARAAAAPPGAVEGQLRLLGGGGGGLGPVGFDLGCLLGSLLLAHAGGAGRRRAAAAEAARGGYARYTAQRSEERWAEHASGLLAAVADVWKQFCSAFLGAWDADAEEAEAAVDRVGNAAAAAAAATAAGGPVPLGTVDMNRWNATPAAPLWRTQAAFLAAVAGDALGFAGMWLLREAGGGGATPPELAALSAAPPKSGGASARDCATARAITVAHALVAFSGPFAADACARARAAGGRDAALSLVAKAFEAAAEAAQAVEANPAWAALEGPTEVEEGTLRAIAEAAAGPYSSTAALKGWY
jgi:hypothetical protein